jgi:hypothetical protein
MRKLVNAILVQAFAFMLVINVQAQKETAPQEFGIKFSGFVKTDIFYDTRQNESLREGHFLLYPKAESFDANNEDLNAVPGFNILSIQTRLTGKITAPDFLGAKTTGMIEGAFFGAAEGNINTFRLRHAFLKMEWENTHLLIGQFWHPMFIDESFPGVVSFNTGAPFQPFSRNPQIRFTQKFGFADLVIAACSQRDFQSYAPGKDATGKEVSVGTSDAARNAVLPELNALLKFKFGNHLAGLGGEYKSLMPRTSFLGVKADNLVNSYAAMAYAKFVFDDFSFKLEGIYGQNLANMTMLGGYGIKTVDSVAKTEEYTPSNLLSAWTELSYGKDVEISLFAGYTKNLGTADAVVNNTFYGRARDIESIIRVSPRLIWTVGKVKIAGEVEYTQAAYGTADSADKLIVKNTKTVSNIRVLLAGYLMF